MTDESLSKIHAHKNVPKIELQISFLLIESSFLSQMKCKLKNHMLTYFGQMGNSHISIL